MVDNNTLVRLLSLTERLSETTRRIACLASAGRSETAAAFLMSNDAALSGAARLCLSGRKVPDVAALQSELRRRRDAATAVLAEALAGTEPEPSEYDAADVARCVADARALLTEFDELLEAESSTA